MENTLEGQAVYELSEATVLREDGKIRYQADTKKRAIAMVEKFRDDGRPLEEGYGSLGRLTYMKVIGGGFIDRHSWGMPHKIEKDAQWYFENGRPTIFLVKRTEEHIPLARKTIRQREVIST